MKDLNQLRTDLVCIFHTVERVNIIVDVEVVDHTFPHFRKLLLQFLGDSAEAIGGYER